MVKLIYLNILGGAKERLGKIISFIKKENPDIVFLSELTYWNKKNFRKFANKLGFKHCFFSKSNTACHLGIFSKLKINKPKSIKKGFVHSLIYFKIKEINFFFTHLSPKNEFERIKEINEILKKIDLDKKTILIGDLNSLSPLDNYNDEKLLSYFNKINLAKFGVVNLRKDVQKKILNFGLIDTLKQFSDLFEYSVPTRFNKDFAHARKLRLDYLYITRSLLPYLKSSKIIRTNETNQLSDHFPIIAKFDF